MPLKLDKLLMPSFICGSLASLLGLTVLLGWYIHNEALIQILPHFVPMQYNTALGFLMSGIGLVALVRNYLKAATIFGGFVALLGGFTLLQYIFNLDFGIDQLLMEHYITTETSHPGRMAPNTALCFFLSGAVLVLLGLMRSRKFVVVSAGILSLVILALAFMALMGYGLGIEKAYGWAGLTRMALHTTLGFLLLAVGFFVYVWKHEKIKVESVSLWVPVTFFVIGLVVTFLFWQFVSAQQDKLIKQGIESESKIIRNQIVTHMEYRLTAMRRMARRWEKLGGVPRDVWETSAADYMKDQPGYQAIQWVDPNSRARWLMPKQGNEAAQDMDLMFENKRAKALVEARETRKITYSGVVDLVQGKKGMLVYFPLFVGEEDRFDGFLVAVFDIHAFLEHALSGHIPRGYDISIYEGDEVVFHKDIDYQWLTYEEVLRDQTQTLQVSLDDTELPISGVLWKIQVAPKRALLLPHIYTLYAVSICGFLLSILFAVISYFIQLSYKRARVVVESEERFRQTYENASIGIALVGLNGEWLQVNPALCDLVGYTEEELLDTDFQSITHPDDLESDLELLQKLNNNEIPSYEMEKRYFHKDGCVIWILLTVGAVRAQNGAPLYYVSQILDLTHRKKAEEALKNTLQELEQANKELEQFAYIASHDLKAPMRGIDNLAKWITEDLEDTLSDDTREKLDLMRQRIKRLEALLEDILSYSRAGRIVEDPEDVDMKDLITDLVDSIALPDSFKVKLPKEMPTVHSPYTPLRQIFLNLISNAHKHHDKDKGKIEVFCEDRGLYYEFAVKDDGPGIPEEFHDRVFQMFQTLQSRDEKEGTGLGMAIIKKLVEWQDGKVWIESKDGKRGTTVRFLWPKNYRKARINYD